MKKLQLKDLKLYYVKLLKSKGGEKKTKNNVIQSEQILFCAYIRKTTVYKIRKFIVMDFTTFFVVFFKYIFYY